MNTLQLINKCYNNISSRSEMLLLYSEAIASTTEIEEFFNKLFQDDKKVILS